MPASTLLTKKHVAEVIGLIVSSFPWVEHGPLYYRSLERDKSNALRGNKGKFWISFLVLERNWWISSVDTSHKLISYGVPELHI